MGRWIFKVPDYSGYKRYATFRTWPKSHPIRPDALTQAGFLYTGEGDKVTCPWSKISRIEWETYDSPMDEHKRHAPIRSFIWGFTSLSTQYRSYHDGYLEGLRKPVHIVRQVSVL